MKGVETMMKNRAPLLIICGIFIAGLFPLYKFQEREIKDQFNKIIAVFSRFRNQQTISPPTEILVDNFSMLAKDFKKPCKGPLNIQNAFKKGDDYSQFGQSTKVAKLLNYKRNGVFFEVGGADGVKYSNSLYFEEKLNWTGLLVEMDHGQFAQLEKVCRNAYALRGCLTREEKPKDVQFVPGGLSSHLLSLVWKKENKSGSGKSTCYPGKLVFKAAGIKKVDYAVVDVEGAELEILDALPFRDVYFDILQMEYNTFWQVRAGWNPQKSKEKYIDYMSKKLPQFKMIDGASEDLFFRNTEKYKE